MIYQRFSRKNKRKVGLRFGVAVLITALLIIIPLWQAYLGFKDVGQHAKALASAYQNQNFGQIQAQVSNIKKDLSKTDLSLNFLFYLKFVPLLGGFYEDAKKLSSASVSSLEGVEMLLSKLKASEEELGFLGQPKVGEQRITQALKILQKSIPYLDSIEPNFKRAAFEVEGINTSKYPKRFKDLELRKTIETAKNFIIGTHFGISEAKDALVILPSTLGNESVKNYLLLFQNDKEIRPTGGFITAFAFLKVDQGKISATTSDDIYRLDERLLATCESKICPLTPPDPIVKYLPEVSGVERSAWSMRDSNISPDVPTSAREFERMYQLLGSGLPFDGIIYIDSQVVEELIEGTGPIDVFGNPYSSKIDHRCNCPNVIFELESYAEIAAKGTQDRKAILGVLMQQILSKMIGADSEKIPLFLETVVRLANHKHILLFMHDPKVQNSLYKLNWTGQIKDFEGDYLHINDANFAGGKSNLYVEQTVTQEITTQKDGIRKKITVEYKNPQPFGVWLNGINRDYVRVYVPKGSKLISSKGSDDQVNTIEDLGKTVFEAFIQVRPQNSRKLEIEYIVPYQPKDKYKLLIQKQPGAKDFQYKIKINGRQKADFKLDTDREFKFDL